MNMVKLELTVYPNNDFYALEDTVSFCFIDTDGLWSEDSMTKCLKIEWED